MRLTRFCSQAEFDAFQRGEILYNNTDHYKGGKGGSTSYGFCFTTDTPDIAWRYLRGIVCPDVVMVLDIPGGLLKPARGKYFNHDQQKLIYKDEWWLKKYSKHSAKLVSWQPVSDFENPRVVRALHTLYYLTHNTTK